MSSTQNPGRVAGLWYLLLTLLAPLRLMYIPSKLFMVDNAAATVNNVADHQLLFRLGIVADLMCGVITVFLGLAFYRLFKGVDQKLAALVVILGGVMPGLIYFVNIINDAGALMIALNADFLSVFDKPQRDALAMLFLRLHGQEITGAEVLWGLWLLPLAMLVWKSRFLPRFLGVWLFINGIAYVIISLTGWFAPQYQAKVFNFSMPALLGEVAIMLWLVIRGAKPPAIEATRLSPAAS